MKKAKYRVAILVVLLLALTALSATARAEETELARDISHYNMLKDYSGFVYTRRLFDKNLFVWETFHDGASFTIEHEEGIGSVYIIFNRQYGTFDITDEETGQTFTAGKEGFLHSFVNLEEIFGHAPDTVTLTFNSGIAMILEVYAFSPGQVPDFVQQWESPRDGETDLVLFSTHGDDEQLFFAGLLPYYAVEKGYQVQVVYFTWHWNQMPIRIHEMLNGLWAVGVKTYPVFGEFPDLRASSAEKGYEFYEKSGYTRKQMEAFVVEQLRRFKPQVAVGHDVINGEYGHGVHIMYAQQLCSGVELTNDPEAYPESAEKYGLWDVPKTYLHLYPENPLVMDWDQPLESFGGMTAFQVTKELGFPCHVTQKDAYNWYIAYAESAASIEEYSPREYGLFRTTVGPDEQGGDMFENVLTYAQQKQAQEEAAREEELEAQRQAEEARLKEERRAREEAERTAQEAFQAQLEEQARLQKEAELEKSRKITLISGISAGILLAVILCVIEKKRKKK